MAGNKIIKWRNTSFIYNDILLGIIQNTSGVHHVYKDHCLTAMVLQLPQTPELLKLAYRKKYSLHPMQNLGSIYCLTFKKGNE